MLGKVDNLVLDEHSDDRSEGHLTVAGIVVGTPGLAPRFGGRLQRWMLSIWGRLRPEVHPPLTVIPLTNVTSIGSTVMLDEAGKQLVAGSAHLEAWLRRYLVSRIPGATGGPDRLSGKTTESVAAQQTPASDQMAPVRLLTDLIGLTVHSTTGEEVGEVLDLCTQPPPSSRRPVGPLAVDCLLCGRRRTGAEMGYSTPSRQGPWIIRTAMRAWQRGDRLVPLANVDRIDWSGRIVVLASPE